MIFLGYDKGPDGGMVVNKEQAEIVRHIYGLFMKGYSYNRIAKILTDEGIPSPRNKGRWNDVCVASILTNETYMGDKMPSTVTEFRPELWASLVDKVTVQGKNDMVFTMTSGAEMRA